MPDICSICLKSVKSKSIQCDICDQWAHQPKCSGLTQKQFEILCQPNSTDWYCHSCINTLLPFPQASQKTSSVTHSSELSDEIKSTLVELNNVVADLTTTDNNEDEIEIQFHANSCSYLSCKEFNSLATKTPTNFSVFHLNIVTLSKLFNEL